MGGYIKSFVVCQTQTGSWVAGAVVKIDLLMSESFFYSSDSASDTHSTLDQSANPVSAVESYSPDVTLQPVSGEGLNISDITLHHLYNWCDESWILKKKCCDQNEQKPLGNSQFSLKFTWRFQVTMRKIFFLFLQTELSQTQHQSFL